MPGRIRISPTGLDVRRAPGKTPLVRTAPCRDITAAADWLAAHRTQIRQELLRSGALMLRGLGFRDTAGFARLRDVLIPRSAGYKEKATPRTELGEGVFSSTDLPAMQPIRLHNENSYTLDFPGTLLFGCITAPEEGGATTVGDMREALRRIPEHLRAGFEATGWLLVRNYSELAGLPWQQTFSTEDPAAVEAYCKAHMIGHEWLPDGSLRTQQRRSAIVSHPVTGEKVWFNHFAFWSQWALDAEVRDVLVETYGEDGLPFDTFLGNSSRLSREDVESLTAVYDEVTVREEWQPGDLLLVDNILCAHGREAFRGDRRIVVAMGDPVRLEDCHPVTEPSTTALDD
ncbi:TauD/TfdA family dioxygenase [Streptomyces sp. NPDC001549]|uniref:TauD/TfdA family dioxygenase n=1 Tax=Streptomyces sp. NPDC001549 TaxID=3364586 RepID=UPI0036BF99D7